MDTETRKFELDRLALPAVQEELASRARLRFTVNDPPWWRFWGVPVVSVTGPSAALDAAADAIRLLDYQAWCNRQW